jgi:hypothetical protein
MDRVGALDGAPTTQLQFMALSPAKSSKTLGTWVGRQSMGDIRMTGF